MKEIRLLNADEIDARVATVTQKDAHCFFIRTRGVT